MLKHPSSLWGCQMGRWMFYLRGILIATTSLEIWWLLPQWRHSQSKCQVGREAVYSQQHICGFSILAYAGTFLVPISPLDLPVTERMTHGSYSLCFFNGDQNLLEDGKLLHVAISAFSLFLPPREPSFLPLCIVLMQKAAQTHSAALCKRFSSSF